MTVNEAIEYIEAINKTYKGYPEELSEACDMAISALKEIQLYKDNKLCLIPEEVYSRQCSELDAYKEIGTVEECREAVEKQKVKKIVYERDSVFCDGFTHYRMGKCPMCDRWYNSNDDVNYCSNCGQAVSWKESEEE